MMHCYTCAIIGCGQIGVLYDKPSNSPDAYTHAKAIQAHPRACLGAVMDQDADRARQAGERWECPHYIDLETMFREAAPELLCICVPDPAHEACLRQVLSFQPRAVIAEKPLTQLPDQGSALVADYQEAAVPLAVNYTRRYEPTICRVADEIRAGHFGQLLSAHFTYSKGVQHNGVHGLQLADFLFGPVLRIQALTTRVDYMADDPSVSAFLSYERCPSVFLSAADERAFSIFELDILGEKARIVFEQGGLRYRRYELGPDPVFPGYTEMLPHSSGETAYGQSMIKLMDNVINHLETGQRLMCSGTDALHAESVCHTLLTQARNL